MAEITIQELEKAAGNIERISAFIGERRDWIGGDGGEEQATAIKGSVKALAIRAIPRNRRRSASRASSRPPAARWHD